MNRVSGRAYSGFKKLQVSDCDTIELHVNRQPGNMPREEEPLD